MIMDPIDASVYITDTDPAAIVARNPAAWFVDEVQAGVPAETLSMMQAQGWVVSGTNAVNGVTVSYDMKRRKLVAESVLAALVADYTTAYNEGRTLNDSRYDEIVTLYEVLLSKTQTEIVSVQGSDNSYDTLIQGLISGLNTDANSYEDDVTGHLDDYGDSIRAQINARFDARLASAQQELVSRGMYNSTIYDTVVAGIERERSLSLSDVEDKISQQQLNLKHKIFAEKSDIQIKVIAARDRLRNSLFSAWDRELAMRNAIVQALVNFMERRTDSYPGLQDVGKLAANLGAGNPTAFAP